MIEQQQQITQNFLNTMDLSMPIIDHFRNAMRDAIIYKWPTKLLIDIMSGIEDAYQNKIGKKQ